MPPATRSAVSSSVLILVAFLALAVCRILGPSDLYDKEQPRTVSYTADILLHQQWILPTDNFDIPATKPPLFNWLSVPFVWTFGYEEWALKMPSLLAAAVVLICIREASSRLREEGFSVEIATLASLFWLATFMTAKLMYVARPDMLVTAFLTLAWVSATEILLNREPRRGSQICLWLSITAAALTKGPIALLPLAYLIFGAKILTRSWQPLKRAGLWWGIPLLAGAFGAWAVLAYQEDAAFFRQVLVGRELVEHLAGGNENGGHKPLRWLITLPNGPLYIVARFLPWSLLPVGAIVCQAYRYFARGRRLSVADDSTERGDFRNHPLAPAILWIGVITLSFCFLSTKRPDRYAPVFPPLALVAAYIALHLPRSFRIPSFGWRMAALVFIAGIALYNQFLDNPARSKLGENTTAFAHAIAHKLGPIGGSTPILFLDGEQTPLQTLLGRHDPATPTLEAQQSAEWCVRFYDPTRDSSAPAAIISAPIPQIDGPRPGRLALYPLVPPQGVEEFQRAQRLPRIYADDSSNQLTTLPADGPRWLQFWRLHSR